jgi:SOS response regulatory protein OraA/RecX
VPDRVVLSCGLAVGLELDRPLLRLLRRELQGADALERAGRAVSRRPLSEKRLEQRLEHAGLPFDARRSAVETLKETQLVDDPRLARERAAFLAARGWGDAAIAARLAGEGLSEGDARAAIEELPEEHVRARNLVAGNADRRKAWALLARRGFSTDSAEVALGTLDEGA